MKIMTKLIGIAGGTGSGKTTTLNCLGMFIPWDKRLLTVEDTAELQVYHDHWLRMETRQERPDGTSSVSMDDCLKSLILVIMRRCYL